MRLGPIVVGPLFVTTCEGSGPRTVGEVESLIRENLPVGSDRVEVIQVLSDRGIETSGLQARTGSVYAIIRSAAGGSTTYGSIAIEFYFDEGGPLLRHELHEVSAESLSPPRTTRPASSGCRRRETPRRPHRTS